MDYTAVVRPPKMRSPGSLSLTFAVAWLVVLLAPPVAGAEDAGQHFRDTLGALTKYESRVVGSPGYAAAVAYVERTAASMSNVEIRRHDYQVMVPVTREATVALGGG